MTGGVTGGDACAAGGYRVHGWCVVLPGCGQLFQVELGGNESCSRYAANFAISRWQAEEP